MADREHFENWRALVNSVITTHQEKQRVADILAVNLQTLISRSGGMIRLTECDDMGTTTSPAFEKFSDMGGIAYLRAGRSFSPEGRNWGITPMLGRFLQQAGCKNIRHTAHVIDYSTGAEAHEGMFHNWMISLKFAQPFLAKMGLSTQEELDHLYQQAMAEMMSDDFSALWYFVTVSGEKP